MRRHITRYALAAMAVALAGCGAADGGSEVASTGGAAKATSSPSSTLSDHEKAVKFTQCLREHGVDVDDPKPGQGPRVQFTGGPEEREKVQEAMKACREYAPQNDQSPGAQKAAEERQRKYAECMREHGVDMPDPKPGQGNRLTIGPEQGNDPDFEDAQKACQDILSGGASPSGSN